MPPRKQPSAPSSPPREDRTERLIDAVEMLAQEINVVRIAIDDIRQELEYAVKILKTNLWLPTSQSADPPSQPTVPIVSKAKTVDVATAAGPALAPDESKTPGHLF